MSFNLSILGFALPIPSLFRPTSAFVAPAVDDPPMGVVGSYGRSYATLDIEAMDVDIVDVQTAMVCDAPASPADIDMAVFDSGKATRALQAVRRPAIVYNDVKMKDAFYHPARAPAKTRDPRPVPMDVDLPEVSPPPPIVPPSQPSASQPTSPSLDSSIRRWMERMEGPGQTMSEYREAKRRRVKERLVREDWCHVFSSVRAAVRCSRLTTRNDEGHDPSLHGSPYRLPSPPPSRLPAPPPARVSSPTPAAHLPSPVMPPIPSPCSPVLHPPSSSPQARLPTGLSSFGLRPRLPTVEQHILTAADMERIGNDYADNLEWISLRHDESNTEQERKFSEEDIFGSDSDEECIEEAADTTIEEDTTEQDMEIGSDDDSEDDDSDAGEDDSGGLDLGDTGFEGDADAVPDADVLSPSSLLQQADNFLWDVFTNLHAHQASFPGTGT
ncbi:hypothetical protein EWM64_g5091 [Hericium alpestre]|uniref:Uncharacterized protein n=1 Tax=Hericium alpestre TaxID=135208 RepID=A0A4Y9ZVS6_9AGAM|nr:hypothetical protein EWM64_g5091 [Hericium alpestre]